LGNRVRLFSVSSFKHMHKHKLTGGRCFFLKKFQQNVQYKYQQPNSPCTCNITNFNKEIYIWPRKGKLIGGLCCPIFIIFLILIWFVKNIDIDWCMYMFIEFNISGNISYTYWFVFIHSLIIKKKPSHFISN
jgi:hypothetical protein